MIDCPVLHRVIIAVKPGIPPLDGKKAGADVSSAPAVIISVPF